MPYTLKSSGIATNLTLCVAVDDNGTTIKDFVSNITLTIDAAVTRGSATWKGNSRAYFSCFGSSFTPQGITMTGPSMNFNSPGIATFIATAGMSAMSNIAFNGIIMSADGAKGFTRTTTSGPALYGSATVNGATSLPTDGTTKFSTGGNLISASTETFYYGLESGSLAQDATGTDTNGPGAFVATSIGGVPGQGAAPGNYFIIALFNRVLTLAEMQSLHGNGTNDWFSTLFNAPSSPVNVNPGVGTLTLTGYAPTISQGGPLSFTPGVGSIAITGYAPTVTRGANGTLATDPLKNNTAGLQASLSGLVAAVFSTSGVLIVSKFSQTTSVVGIMTITDPLIVPGTTYVVLLMDPFGTAVGATRLVAT